MDRLRAAGANDRQIAVLTPYKGQPRLLRTWETADLTMATINSAQGKEYDFVILDLVTPSRRLCTLGFPTDPRRKCVALSRAKIGLLIIGDKNKANVAYLGAGTRAWKQLIDDHVTKDAVCEKDAWDFSGQVKALMREHHIPSVLCEEAPRGGYLIARYTHSAIAKALANILLEGGDISSMLLSMATKFHHYNDRLRCYIRFFMKRTARLHYFCFLT